MQIRVDTRPIHEIDCDALVVVAFDKDSPGGALPWEVTRAADTLASGWIQQLYDSAEFTGKVFETAVLHHPPGLAAKRLVLIGAGKRDKFTTADLRRVSGAALRFLKPKSMPVLALALDAGAAAAEQVAAAIEGAILGDFEPDQYKTEKKEAKVVEEFVAVAPGGEASLEEDARRARIIAEAQNFTRGLVSEPANRMTPALLAERARQLAAGEGLACEVLDQDRLRQLGMGALLGVAQGSAEPPVLIVLRYRPADAPEPPAHLGLIGKGVTFDSGGISIKPSDGMEKMKYDMAGAAAVIGAMRAIAQLRPAIAVTAVAPAVENMPGGRAQRPGDIVTTLSGKTVEVINTDAEGRLILADALTYARRLGCTHLVDAATLTGAIVVALGHVYVGLFSSDDALRDRLLEAGRAAGDKLWPMPLDDDYKEQLKSAFADLPNTGGRWGGAVTAAMFLKEFADTTPWAHLDIAGTAWLEDAKPYLAKGPSGVPVRTLLQLALKMGSA
jgi:leucyl aminopeptidase